MTASLSQSIGPLNDPAVTMQSTEVVSALDLLGSGIPTLRCAWGKPGQKGVATNVSIVTPAQATTLQHAFEGEGFACAAGLGGTLCTRSRTTLTLQDTQVTLGEIQLLRANAWISTRWITTNPDGYTADIVAHLWP